MEDLSSFSHIDGFFRGIGQTPLEIYKIYLKPVIDQVVTIYQRVLFGPEKDQRVIDMLGQNYVSHVDRWLNEPDGGRLRKFQDQLNDDKFSAAYLQIRLFLARYVFDNDPNGLLSAMQAVGEYNTKKFELLLNRLKIDFVDFNIKLKAYNIREHRYKNATVSDAIEERDRRMAAAREKRERIDKLLTRDDR